MLEEDPLQEQKMLKMVQMGDRDALLALSGAVVQAASLANATIATAESCTGGMVAAQITATPGASQVFMGGVVSYDNAVKTAILGVDPLALEREGAVSATVALQMAAGVRKRLGVDIAVSTTGIAGPGGGSAQKPVGTVWIAIDHVLGQVVELFVFDGDRECVRAQATAAALRMLSKSIQDLFG